MVARWEESKAGGDVGSAIVAKSTAERVAGEAAVGEAKRRSSIVLAIVSVLREAERGGSTAEVVEPDRSCVARGGALERSCSEAFPSKIK